MLNTRFLGGILPLFVRVNTQYNLRKSQLPKMTESYFQGRAVSETSYPGNRGGRVAQKDRESWTVREPRRQVQSGAIRKCLTPFCNLGNTGAHLDKRKVPSYRFNKFGNSPE
jgi:hypothetical protein